MSKVVVIIEHQICLAFSLNSDFLLCTNIRNMIFLVCSISHDFKTNFSNKIHQILFVERNSNRNALHRMSIKWLNHALRLSNLSTWIINNIGSVFHGKCCGLPLLRMQRGGSINGHKLSCATKRKKYTYSNFYFKSICTNFIISSYIDSVCGASVLCTFSMISC